MLTQNDLTEAFEAATQGEDPTPITKILPALIRERAAAVASELAKELSDNALPEKLMLLNVPGLSERQKKQIMQTLFAGDIDDMLIPAIADASARIGSYGFSFPQWRFLTQGVGGPSLIEHFGLKRLERDTDISDASLPKSNPERDHFGIGFVSQHGGCSIEFRRAYILCADQNAALVIRNSSYFFGRDRLPHAAYVCWQPMTPAQLDYLNDESFAPGSPFIPWQQAFMDDGLSAQYSKATQVKKLLNRLDDFTGDFELFLSSRSGVHHLANFLEQLLTRQALPFYLAHSKSHMPPWFIRQAVPADALLLKKLQDYAADKPIQEIQELLNPPSGETLVLLSGPNGDLPLKPAGKPVPAATFIGTAACPEP